MKLLLFDHNLSPKLVERLEDLFPNSLHVIDAGLDKASDREVWDFARNNGFIITTKDADFTELGVLWGFPPKVIWIRRGNCSTRTIEKLLRDSADAINNLDNDTSTGILILY